ncbi:zinc finger protein [Cinnamomum micranthum f. kanehirae]|uniref:Zinc finger protein n=1 Tax=Cinnamomum micranthum f. kanehirae TaxID=337451 RepID=A0A3S3MLW6_9MAGN|nr:zinc finger protein [Cinnamomum micranthum f. kanehirae]
MEEDAAHPAVLTDGDMVCETSSRIETKRPHECVVDSSTNEESLPNKKQALEELNSDSIPEASDVNVSTVENASICQAVSSQPTDCSSRSSRSETTSISCGDMPSISAGNSSTASTGSKEPSREGLSIDLSTSQKPTGIRKLKIIFGKSRGLGNSISVSAGQNTSTESDNGPSVKDPKMSIAGAGRSNGNKKVNFSADPSTAAQMGISGAGTFRLCCPKEKMELKMSKKVVPNELPSNVKRLLSTGLLEGVHVKYISWVHKKDLRGIIKDCGYLCGCPSCNFSKVLNAFEFEKHAGCFTKHPNNHIFLENGKTIYGLVQEVKSSPFNMLEEVIRTLLGGPISEKHLQVWKESFQVSRYEIKEINGNDEASQHCPLQLQEENNSILASEESLAPDSSSPVQALRVKLKNPMIQKKLVEQKLVARSTSADSLPGPRTVASNPIVQRKSITVGGSKKRDNDLHRLVFMPNGLPDGTLLAYYIKGQRLLEGYKQGNGIFCSCCDNEVSPSQFEAHAGWATRRQPYRHIYTSNGLSLHDLSISLSNGQSPDTGDNDDLCTVCGDGGELVLCDRCPRAFHTVCLELQCVPEADWQCPYCKDYFGPGRKTTLGETAPSAPRPIFIRLKRVVKAPTTEIGGCVVCRGHDFSVLKFDERTVMLCDQCEKEFHVGCLRDSGLCDLKELPKGKWFCSADCSGIHTSIRKLIFNGSEMVPTSLSSVIKKKLEDKGLTNEAGDDVQWQLLSGKIGHSGNKPLLSKAAAIFRDCFDPIVVNSGRDLIPAMVYGRNIAGQEFGGLYCAVLTVNSVVVSAGILRIFGQEVAEIPLVATSKESQGKGYFQVLFSCIERLLCQLNVENLVLPAAEEAESIWTNKFGFSRMTDEQLQKYRRNLQIMVFQGTSMLEKAVPQFCD